MRSVVEKLKCKYCPTLVATMSDLKSHFYREHQQKLVAITRWLDDTTLHKLQVAETLAAEGMKGHKAS